MRNLTIRSMQTIIRKRNCENTDFNRYGIRAAVGYKPNDRFHLDLNLATTLTRNSNGSGNAFSQSGVAAGSAASSLLPPPSMYTASNSALSVFLSRQIIRM